MGKKIQTNSIRKPVDTSDPWLADSVYAFQAEFIQKLFDDGVMVEYPGADFYCVAYGDICAYRDDGQGPGGQDTLLALWSCGGYDCREDMQGTVAEMDSSEFAGHWTPYTVAR